MIKVPKRVRVGVDIDGNPILTFASGEGKGEEVYSFLLDKILTESILNGLQKASKLKGAFMLVDNKGGASEH